MQKHSSLSGRFHSYQISWYLQGNLTALEWKFLCLNENFRIVNVFFFESTSALHFHFIENYKNKENVSNISRVYALSIFQMYTNLM